MLVGGAEAVMHGRADSQRAVCVCVGGVKGEGEGWR